MECCSWSIRACASSICFSYLDVNAPRSVSAAYLSVCFIFSLIGATTACRATLRALAHEELLAGEHETAKCEKSLTLIYTRNTAGTF